MGKDPGKDLHIRAYMGAAVDLVRVGGEHKPADMLTNPVPNDIMRGHFTM